jgi:hypothetical protein
MTTTATWLNTPMTWLDARGKPAWLAAMILSFVFVWPLGLAILFYMIWSKRMPGSFFCNRSAPRALSPRSTGNSAFDAYRDNTLARLEDEQAAFNAFLARLRDAKDKTEFDAFMNERSREVETVSDKETA